MPYDEINNLIHTKTLGVVAKNIKELVHTEMFEEQEIEQKDNGQKVLKEMFLNVNAVKYIYLKYHNTNYDVHVAFNDGRDYNIGFVKRDYNALLNTSKFLVKAWKITGGKKIHSVFNRNNQDYYGYYGLNLTIKVTN